MKRLFTFLTVALLAFTGGVTAVGAEAEDIEVNVAEGDISEAIAKASQGKNVGSIFVNLQEGVTYTISSSIVGSSDVFVIGKGAGATIDASSLNAPFIALANVDSPTEWTNVSVGINNVTIKGLKNALFYSTCQKYLIEELLVINSIVEVAGDATTFDFTKGSAVHRFTIESSTFYAPTATTKSFFSSQAGQKITDCDAGLKQEFYFSNSTFYNLAKDKNFFTHRQNSQKWEVYDVKNNIFVNCGKSGQTIKGINGGGSSANPVWRISGNVFNFLDANTGVFVDTSAAEDTGDAEEPVADSVAGIMTFTDAAAGNFNGTFELAEGAEAPKALGDPRWTITYKEYVAPVVHTWDFTAWSEETISNLKAEATKVTVEDDPENEGKTMCTMNGAIWSDHEKANKCDTYDASKDNCFWYVGGEAEPTANGVAIAELKGLVFNTTYGGARSLAIAVNYPSTSLGTYEGGSYLWLGGKDKDCFTIKSVKVGSELVIAAESHKPAEGRGIQLMINGEKFGDAFTPTTFAEKTWTITSSDETAQVVDVVVHNTNGCHLYYIDVIDNTTVGIQTVTTTMENGAYYDLQGRRVAQPVKGLYIVNGKKVVLK